MRLSCLNKINLLIKIFIILALFVSFSLYSNFFTCFDIFHAFFACPVALSESNLPQISNTTIKKRKRLTKAEQEAIKPSQEQIDILVGAFLGDAYSRKYAKSKNSHVRFDQSTIHKEYLYYLFSLLKDLCGMAQPRETSWFNKSTKTSHNSYYFVTYSLPCLNKFHDLFYVNGKKVVPINIADYLNPRALAILLQDDPHWSKREKTVIISTNAFTLQDCTRLCDALLSELNLIAKPNITHKLKMVAKLML